MCFFKKKKKKKNTCRYHYQNLDDMIYSSWDIDCPFTPIKTPKIKILKNEKICWRYHHFTHVYQKSQSCDVQFLRYGVRQAEFFVILGHFLPFQPPDNPKNQNFKIEKNTWRYYHFTNVYPKWQSYDVWFLRYEVWRTEFFVILDRFLPFYPPPPSPLTIQKSGDIVILHMCTKNDNHIMYGSWDMKRDRQNFLSLWTAFCHFTPQQPKKSKFWKTEKNAWRYYHFKHVHHKWQSNDVWFLRYEARQTIFCHFGLFFALLPP